MQIAPTIGAAVGRAAVIGQSLGPAQGLQAMAQIEESAIRDFQPAWATRADLLAKDRQSAAARQAYERAVALTHEPALRHYLLQRSRELPA